MSANDAQAALAFWFGRINYEQRTPRPGDMKLHSIRALLARLGDPHQRLPIIHVAGSKGKGSTSAFLAAILRRAGYRTGLFTSPHLVAIEERFQVDGQSISQPELLTLLRDVQTAVEKAPALDATFFEVATAVGFLHFVRRRVEIAVIEVGLGGRFDSTNVSHPAVSLITSISFDHMRQLGNTLARIAREKAGILKPGVPGISGATVPEAAEVIDEVSRLQQAPLRVLGRDFGYQYEPGRVTATTWQWPRVRVQSGHQLWPWMELGLFGEHQAANAAVAVACVEELRRQGWHLPEHAVVEGLRQVEWPARLEVMCRRPLILLDCAHNVASAAALVDTLKTSFIPEAETPGRRILVFAGSSDKDLAGMVRVLASHFDHAVLTCHGNQSRVVSVEELAQICQANANWSLTLCPSAEQAWKAVGDLAEPNDVICITGSVFLAGELRPQLLESRERMLASPVRAG